MLGSNLFTAPILVWEWEIGYNYLMFDIYENFNQSQQIAQEAKESWEVDRIEMEDGIRVYLKGCDYPQKGMVTPDALYAINQVKKVLLTSVRTFHVFLLFFSKQKLVDAFNTICWGIVSPYTLKPKYRNDFTLEIGGFIYSFLREYGISEESSEKFANIVSHVFEYDNAYRLRVQDLFSSTNFERLNKNPRKEIKRLLRLNRERDFKEANLKFKLFSNLTSLALLSPKVKRCFRKALKNSDYVKLQFDKGDLFWSYQRIDYDVFGLNYQARRMENS